MIKPLACLGVASLGSQCGQEGLVESEGTVRGGRGRTRLIGRNHVARQQLAQQGELPESHGECDR
jgi:hypothetical protein